MPNAIKMYPTQIWMKGINVAGAALMLKHYTPESNVTTIPSDVDRFLLSINWSEKSKGPLSSMIDWPGNEWIDGFLARWDWDDEIEEKSKACFTPIYGEINRAMKYFFSWKVIYSMLCFKPVLCSELVWESISDLEASFHLAKEGFYKQALQMLRNYLEVCVTILYFGININAQKKWKLNGQYYEFPKYHTDMVNSLKPYFFDDEITDMSNRYRKLNSSVHSRRHRINWNIGRLEREQKDCGANDIKYWSKTFCSVVGFMSKQFLLKIFHA